jgi:hypothetical protein
VSDKYLTMRLHNLAPVDDLSGRLHKCVFCRCTKCGVVALHDVSVLGVRI